MEKIKIPQWMFNLLIGAILFSYGYIFSMITERIKTLEYKYESINPILVEIQTNLAEISTDIKWLKTK